MWTREEKNAYNKQWYKNKRQSDPDWLEKHKLYQRNYQKKRRAHDSAFRDQAKQRRIKYRLTEKGRTTELAYSRRYSKLRPDLFRAASFKRHHGVTLAEADAMALAQGNRCLICQKEPTGKKNCARLHVDHDHKTGKIRGMICHCCNQCLGFAHDSPAILRALADYLDKHV